MGIDKGSVGMTCGVLDQIACDRARRLDMAFDDATLKQSPLDVESIAAVRTSPTELPSLDQASLDFWRGVTSHGSQRHRLPQNQIQFQGERCWTTEVWQMFHGSLEHC